MIGPFHVPAGGDVVAQTVLTLPHLAPGPYEIQVYGYFDAGAAIRVRPSGG